MQRMAGSVEMCVCEAAIACHRVGKKVTGERNVLNFDFSK